MLRTTSTQLNLASANIGTIIQEGFKVQVNSGQDTYFWHHVWLGESALKENYPRLYRISSQKDKVISDLKEGNGSERWNLHFNRELYVREGQQLEELLHRLQAVTLDQSKRDCLQWKWSPDHCFKVKSMYSQWEQIEHLRNEVMEAIWKNLSPPKVEIFS